MNGAQGQQNPWQGQAPGPQWGGQQPSQSSFGGWGGYQSGPGYQAPPQGFPQHQPQQYGQGPAPFPPPAPKRRQNRAPVIVLIGFCAGLLGILGTYALTGGGSGLVGPNYQNEDYEVPGVRADQPPLPEPQTMEEVIDWLENNAWYGQNLPEPVRCELTGSEFAAEMDNAAIEERITELTNCLTRAVGPSLEEAGMVPVNPRFTVYGPGAEVTTQCGTAGPGNAFYCPADQSMYLSPDLTEVLPAEEAAAAHLFDYVMAHEYAHSLQGRTGLLVAMRIAQFYSEEEPEQFEYDRRFEVQADCFAATMLTSLRTDLDIPSEEFQSMSDIAYEIGDDRIMERFDIDGHPDEYGHGTGDSRRLWFDRGAEQLDMGSCNTFVAPSEEVR